MQRDPGATSNFSAVGLIRLTENSQLLIFKKQQNIGIVYLFNMQKFKPVNNQQYFLLPPSVEDFIKEDHLARLVAEVVDNLNTASIEKQYSLLGQKSYHPKLLLKLLFYGYAIGIRSGRKIAAACESDVAFMYLACMYKPDFRTINDFRKNNVKVVEQLFVEVVKLCGTMNM